MDQLQVKPTPGRVALRLLDAESTTESGIILLQNEAERSVVGEVLAVCEQYELDSERYDPLFEVGQLVVVGKYSGTQLTVGRGKDAKKVLIVREQDVLAYLFAEGESLRDGRLVQVHERD